MFQTFRFETLSIRRVIVAARARSTSLQLPQCTVVIAIIKDSSGDCKGNIWIFLGWADKFSGPLLWKLIRAARQSFAITNIDAIN